MNTFFLKVGCFFLFGLIFFLSFQAEHPPTHQLLSQEQTATFNPTFLATNYTRNAQNKIEIVEHYIDDVIVVE